MAHYDTPSQAVLRTLLYAQVFHAGIQRNDLFRLLISSSPFSVGQIEKASVILARKRKIHADNEWLYLGRKDIRTNMEARLRESEKKKIILKKLLPRISWIPTIKGIAITGSVAVSNATPSEDIDLLIVTKTGFLWCTRLLVEGIFYVSGCLRTRGMKKVKNKLCLNLWIDESSLSFHSKSLYVARELAQSVWVIDKENVRLRTLKANMWAKTYVATTFSDKKLRVLVRTRNRNLSWGHFLSLVELAAYVIQTTRMRGKTREIVSLHAAFFHPRNTQGEVGKKFQQLCRRYNV